MALLRTETRPNLFDICGMKANSPFQIDGNLGGTAGIAVDADPKPRRRHETSAGAAESLGGGKFSWAAGA